MDFENEKINLKAGKSKQCHCKYCRKFHRGELIRKDGKHYSARDRDRFYPKLKNKHLCPGHYHGYRFVIERFTGAFDIVADPCCGTGTALCEAMLLRRRAVGAELEFHPIARRNTEYFHKKTGTPYLLYRGDARKVILKKGGLPVIRDPGFSLIVSGPPYFGEHDAPERKVIGGEDSTFKYDQSVPNIAFEKNEKKYFEELKRLYMLWSEHLAIGGYLCFIVKDYMKDKKVFKLHEKLIDMMVEDGRFKVDSIYSHYHWPPTMFMSTYNKIHPNAQKVPKYQIISVLKKVS